MISVGGLFYNAEPFLDGWTHSLLAQNYPKTDVRLILIYGESADATLPKLKQFIHHYTRPWRRPFAEIDLFAINRIIPDFQPAPNNEDRWDRYRLGQENICKVYNHLIELSKPDDLIILEQDVEAPPDALQKLVAMRDFRDPSGQRADMTAGVTLVTGGEMKLRLWDGGFFKATGLPYVSACVFKPGTHDTEGISLQCNQVNMVRLPPPLMNKLLWVDASATGMSLLTRRLMDSLRFEWNHRRSQDLDFCVRAREQGFHILVDTGLWYEHRHYKYRREVGDEGMYVTLTDSLKRDGIRFEREQPALLASSHLK